jgi:hypothetical protein
VIPSMRTLSAMVDGGRCRCSADREWRVGPVTVALVHPLRSRHVGCCCGQPWWSGFHLQRKDDLLIRSKIPAAHDPCGQARPTTGGLVWIAFAGPSAPGAHG